MKRLIVIAAALVTLTGVSAVTAAVASASVCQPNGTGCTKAGTYPGPNAVISNNYTGFKVVWTKSVVQPYSSGVPLYWTAYMTYTNVTSSTLTLGCPGDWANASNVSERMSGGSGDDGTVLAEKTICSENPNLAAPVSPGSKYTLWATFHNVPWPGSAVAITWGSAGTSANVYPFQSGPSPVIPSDGWNGYVQPGANDSLVSTAWKVPKDNCQNTPSLPPAAGDAIWVGLGGVPVTGESATPLVQIGTNSQCDHYLYVQNYHLKNGVRQDNSAIYEIVIPNGSDTGPIKIPHPVKVGDSMTSYVEYAGHGVYDMYLSDHTGKWNWSKEVTVSDSRLPTAADWIVESGGNVPLVGHRPMANFGSVTFSGMYYETTTNGVISGHGLTDSSVIREQYGSQTSVAPIANYNGVIKWTAPH